MERARLGHLRFFHDPGDSVIYWPYRQVSPTHGGPHHRAE